MDQPVVDEDGRARGRGLYLRLAPMARRARGSVLPRALVLVTVAALAFAAGWVVRGEGPASDPAVPEAAPAPPGPVERFDALRTGGDVDAALALYGGAVGADGDPAEAEALRAHLFDSVRARRGDPAGLGASVRLLEALVETWPRDAEALAVLAAALERQGRVRDALARWWAVLDAAVAGPLAERARRRALALVDVLAAGAAAQPEDGTLVALYREALARDPTTHRVRLRLARALEDRGEPDAALDALAAIPPGAVDAGAVDALRRRLDESVALAERFPEGLPLTPHGDHFAIEATLPGGRVLRLLLDTGATLTVLRPAVLGSAAGARPADRTIRLGTANGVTSAPLWRLDALHLGPVAVEDLRVAALSLEGLEDVDGLLGMDALGRLDYRIDPAAGRLHLAHRRD
jgi:predicted aspartyl protease